MKKIGGRFITNKTNIPNQEPTVSIYDDIESGNWINTDIFEGEMYLNTYDERMWFRNSSKKTVEIPTLNSDLKIKEKYLPDIYGKLNYKGFFNATLPLPNAVKGDYYIISENCNVEYVDYLIGDLIVFNNNWGKIDNHINKINTCDIIYDKKSLNNIIDDLYYNINNIEIPTINTDYLNITKIDSCELNATFLHATKIKTNLLTVDNLTCDVIKTAKISTDNLFIHSGKIYLNDNTTYIQGNGKGVNLYNLNKSIFEYKSSNNNTKFNSKISYNNDYNFEKYDLITKNYVDELNKTLNLNIDDISETSHLIEKNIKYINIDINTDKKIEFKLDKNNSSILIFCISSNIIFNISVNDYEINNTGFYVLYYNNKENKIYKI